MDAQPDEPGLHGMGMIMARLYVQNMGYNETGQRGLLRDRASEEREQRHPGHLRRLPGAALRGRAIHLLRGRGVGLPLLHRLGYCCTCTRRASWSRALTPDDIFLGEMSFLLSNRRSATIVSKGNSVLIRISKQDFVNLIKENPHYGIFLARLLAQRLARLNLRMSRLNTEYLKLKEPK
ncbi:MAG: cyclic nucleotide-binding domain-containing protein [Desulfobacterales bacterium]|nr:cyclic nucleotide-binding domain-containing protein [Desulfobacterales bacterium]